MGGKKVELVFNRVEDYIRSRITICPKTGCWLWGNVKRGNYGWFAWGTGKERKCAHVELYKHNRGAIPEGLIVRHICDDTRCVNPAHLILGTKKDNRRDFIQRHPKAKKIMKAAAKRAQAGCRNFWASMTDQEKEEFCTRRAAIQTAKHPAGSEARKKTVATRKKNYPKGHALNHQKALKAWDTRRKRHG